MSSFISSGGRCEISDHVDIVMSVTTDGAISRSVHVGSDSNSGDDTVVRHNITF